MRPFTDFFTNLVFNLFVIAMIVMAVAPMGTTAQVALAAVLLAGALVRGPLPAGVLANEAVRQLISSDLQEKFWPDNAFFSKAQSDAAAIDVEKVTIPQDEDGDVEVLEDPDNFPIAAIPEEDKVKDYGVHEFHSRPTFVTQENQLLLSYDKRASKQRKHTNAMLTRIADRIAYEWSPTNEAQIVRTTGSSYAGSIQGQTGNRKGCSWKDFLEIQTRFGEQDVPMAGLISVMTPRFYQKLVLEDEVRKYFDRGKADVLKDGDIGNLFGITIFIRSRIVRYTNDELPTKQLISSAVNADDNASALFFHPNAVRYAKGTIEVDMDDKVTPGSGGKRMGMRVRSGGVISRISQKGVIALVETAV